MNGQIDLYYFPPSPPCRSVLMLGKALRINFNLKNVNIMAGEHITPEFLKVTTYVFSLCILFVKMYFDELFSDVEGYT